MEELDVEGILGFAERVLPNASDLWVQASLDQKQRLQQSFFPDGLRFDGKRLVRTRVTFTAFKQLEVVQSAAENLVDQIGASSNRLTSWLRDVDAVRRAA